MLRDINKVLENYDENNTLCCNSLLQMDKETIEDLRCFLEDYESENYKEETKNSD